MSGKPWDFDDAQQRNSAIRKVPALTMVAECKYALTGAGAAMALGSQKWKGNWADLVKAPANTSKTIGT